MLVYTEIMFEGDAWFDYLAEGERDLVVQAYRLLEESGIRNKELGGPQYHDYSFVVFPMAKAFEGFLKQVFLEAGLITEATYNGDRFRIGKSLNPALPPRARGIWWLYGPLKEQCGEVMPQVLWTAWKDCRNMLFHFFPQHKHFITLVEAEQRLGQLKEAMVAMLRCGLIENKT